MAVRTRRLLVAFPGAVVLNVVILVVLTLLSRERPADREFADAVPVRLVRRDPPREPEEVPREPPKRPEPKMKPDFTPDLLRPSLARFGLPDIGVTIDPGRFEAPEGSDFVFAMEDVDQQPVPIVQTQPIYPERPLRLGIEGKVVVKFLVMADGSVQNVEIVSARPEGYFEEAVLKAASTWRFRPGKIKGRAVNSWWLRDINFTMQ